MQILLSQRSLKTSSGDGFLKTPPLVADWHLTGMVQAERRMLMVMEREELLLDNGKKTEGCNYWRKTQVKTARS